MELYVQAVNATFNQHLFINCIDVIYIQYPHITKKWIFYTVVESILSYNCENFDSGLQIQDEDVKYRNKFFEKHCKNVKTIKSKKWSN
jgi:hypothetical protein